MISQTLSALVILCLCAGFHAFTIPINSIRNPSSQIERQDVVLHADGIENKSGNGNDRRSFLAILPALSPLLMGKPANANDELFRPNPLTNRIFEQVSL
jgi:hypothetical protein